MAAISYGMTIQQFVSDNATVTPNSDIVERWESRIVAQGMHLRGRLGAENYLGNYGRGLKVPKAIALARIAEIKGCTDMAHRFWEEAFFLATGSRGSMGASSGVAPAAVTLPAVALKASFGRTPQLPTITDSATIERMMNDDNYGMQEKQDGRNTMLDVQDGVATGGNKKGLVAALPLAAADAAVGLGANFKMDAENVGGVLHAFDLLEVNGDNLRRLGYDDRHEKLVDLARSIPTGALRVILLVKGRKAKFAFRNELRARGAEGFILKRLDAPYTPGDTHEAQFKCQFRALGTFLVGERNGLKNSVQISVYRPDGTLRDMGNMTVPGKADIPAKGSVVEVEYLYCHTGATGKLHQPVMKGIRDDADPSDCLEAKLKIRADAGDE